MNIGRHLHTGLVQDAHVSTAESADEVTEFQDHVLPCSRHVGRRGVVDQAATVITRQEDYSEADVGVALKFLNQRATFVRLFLENDWVVSQLRDEPGNGVARPFPTSVDHKDVASELGRPSAD